MSISILGPLWLASVLAQLPVVAAAGLAAHRMADGSNVVSLWRILVGMPACLLWNSMLLAAGIANGVPWIAPLALALGWLGCRVHRTFLLQLSAFASHRLAPMGLEALRCLAGSINAVSPKNLRGFA